MPPTAKGRFECRIPLPAAAPGVWWSAIIGAGGSKQRRMLQGSGCTVMSLKTDSTVRMREAPRKQGPCVRSRSHRSEP
jgi:hypothetical protein